MSEDTNAWQAPIWLTAEYLTNILRKYHQDDTIQIERVDIKPATATGENYLSVMTRITIFFKTAADKVIRTSSFIVKYSFESDPDLREITNELCLFNTEMKMYDQVLPQLAKILQESGGDGDKLFAETLHVDYHRSAVLLEDLKIHDYMMGNRLQGMDEEHCHLIMKKLAKFHAAAAVLNERLHGALEEFDHGIFNRHTHGFGRFIEPFVKVCANYAKTCPELGNSYYDKLSKLQPQVFENALRAYSGNGNAKHFLTLNHGDLWINNVMLLYDKSPENSSKLKDILFVDFQFTNWSSPAVDLYLFFNTSLEAEKLVDMDYQDKLVQCYHAMLRETLEKLKYSGHIPTLHELQVQLEEGRFLAVTGVIGHQAVATAEACIYSDFHSLIDDTERANKFRLHCYNNKRFQNVVKIMLPYFDRRGLLDMAK